jgi:hypothetical protein
VLAFIQGNGAVTNISGYSYSDNPGQTGKYKYRLKQIDFYGEEVSLLGDEITSAGSYEVQFNAKSFPSGVYFCTIKAVSTDGKNNFSAVKKMILLK